MSREFRICMAKGGRGCLRPSYRRPKLTLVSRFVVNKLRRNGSKTLRQILSERSETNRTWTPIWWVHVLFVSKQSDENWLSVVDFKHLLIFCKTINFFSMTSFWAAITSKRRLGHPNQLQGIPKNTMIKCFDFAKKWFSWPNRHFLPVACHTYSESY